MPKENKGNNESDNDVKDKIENGVICDETEEKVNNRDIFKDSTTSKKENMRTFCCLNNNAVISNGKTIIDGNVDFCLSDKDSVSTVQKDLCFSDEDSVSAACKCVEDLTTNDNEGKKIETRKNKTDLMENLSSEDDQALDKTKGVLESIKSILQNKEYFYTQRRRSEWSAELQMLLQSKHP